jgi:release factor glutamine methyltransferase
MLRDLAAQLPGDSARLDAQVLLAQITGRNRAWLLSHPEIKLTPAQEEALQMDIRQLQDGVPLPYVLGHWEFFGLDFKVTPAVLIPRPETELLIETALGWLKTHPAPRFRFLEVGTGSGIIPITLAVHVPHAEIVATEISPAALAVARVNAEKHGVAERIEFVEADLLPADLDLSTFHLIAANLPYIPTETVKTLEIHGKEPTLALDGGPDGLDLIRRLLDHLTAIRATGCLVLLEIENRQGPALRALVQAAFPAADLQIKKDLAGHDRLAVFNT